MVWHRARVNATDSPTRALPSGRILVWSVVRVVAAICLVFALYAVAPVDADGAPRNWLFAILAVVAFVLVVLWQLREVSQSAEPVIRGVEALVIVVLLFLAMFAVQYVTQSALDSDAFSEPLDKFTGAYYAVTVFSTVGFGDITPVAVTARSITMVQMLGNLILLGAVVRVVAGAAREGLERKRRGAEPDAGPEPID